MVEARNRVVMVSAGFYPYLVGGAERQALELSAALARRGAYVRVLTRRLPRLSAQEEVRGVQVLRLRRFGSGTADSLTFMSSLFFWLLRHASSYDVIHVHLAGSPALPAAVAGRLLGKRVVIKLGGGRGIGELAASSQTAAGRLKLRVLAWLKPQFVAVARELAEEASRYLGGVPVHIMPNGVDTERFQPAAARKEELRSQLGWPRGLGFLYAGRFSAEKRLPWFIEIWAELIQKSGSDAFIAFVGEGPEKDFILRAAETGRVARKTFFHAPLEDPAPAYAAADVFILPSVSEGLSNALLEAMSSGLAVLASRVGGTAEAVEEARSGFLFTAGDSGDLRVQLGKLLAHPELVAAFGKAARRRVEEDYSLDSVVSRYEALYGFEVRLTA
jgi:glycosyltransferase involved in cell wall biosynthesis